MTITELPTGWWRIQNPTPAFVKHFNTFQELEPDAYKSRGSDLYVRYDVAPDLNHWLNPANAVSS